ncbi:hypothetical protein [Paracoccus amoyensis]|uniref:hypothetical protein n=1 Tax=Paracoccus amoyensis TaxID=2760093 RepID=UPI001659C4B9|nr:hypothetical protein [Paracoccus amoyensis]
MGQPVIGGENPAAEGAVSFWIEQTTASSKTVFVEVMPLSGDVADFDGVSWSHAAGRAEQPPLSKQLLLGADDRFAFQLSAKNFDRLNEVFELKVYESSGQASWGHDPLIESTFSMPEGVVGPRLVADHFDFSAVVEKEVIFDFEMALNKILLNHPTPPEADNSLAKPDGYLIEHTLTASEPHHDAALAAINEGDFIFA